MNPTQAPTGPIFDADDYRARRPAYVDPNAMTQNGLEKRLLKNPN